MKNKTVLTCISSNRKRVCYKTNIAWISVSRPVGHEPLKSRVGPEPIFGSSWEVYVF